MNKYSDLLKSINSELTTVFGILCNIIGFIIMVFIAFTSDFMQMV